ncbi:MAG: hypothetical protein IPN66_06170 [Candidatus Competibacteraceae bacterium]|nr:hypothetical protein [Candidatus Competibacteraceae bacterium]
MASGEVSAWALSVSSHWRCAASTTSPGTVARMQFRVRRLAWLATSS